jgi:hypothetical protein
MNSSVKASQVWLGTIWKLSVGMARLRARGMPADGSSVAGSV